MVVPSVEEVEGETAGGAQQAPPIPALLGELPETEVAGRPILGELELVATTFNPAAEEVADDLPLYPVTYDPHMVIVLRVDEILGGGDNSPFTVGEEVGLLVHSPALMFGGYGFSGRQFVYTFVITRDPDGGTSYTLTGLDIWPRSKGGE